jgi:UDP-N-acetylmuramyl tripeptide synthase
MIEQGLADSGISYFANKSGANLLSGVTAEFAMHASVTGKCKYDYALIESDEAAFKAISRYVDAKAVVVTNVFRDQLDRYGEITHTLNNIRIGIQNNPNAVLCLNADDSLSGSLARDVDNPVVFYGVDTPIYRTRVEELSDAPYCSQCRHAYVYDYVTYGHLGGFRCPNCGAARPQTQVSVTQVHSSDAEKSCVTMKVDGVEYPTNINLPGGYNIYNGCAAMAAGKALGLDLSVVSASLSSFACGFGRMEKFDIGDASLRMILIKNPAGCNQVLNFLTEITEPFVFAVCLNDRTQDGKDVSWIWDVDFERLVAMNDLLEQVLVSGVRADDMAMRFKYAGLPEEKIRVIRDYAELTKVCVDQKRPVYIMPTYTAMLSLRSTISKQYGFKAFWE